MGKRIYSRPETEIEKLIHDFAILGVSGGPRGFKATRQSYETESEYETEDGGDEQWY